MKVARFLPVVCALLATPAVALAQQGIDAAESALFRFGPLSLSPKVQLQNLGLDTNVFNSAESPVRDTTAIVAPGLDAWLRVGRLRVKSETTTEWIYYRTASSERSFNVGEILNLEVDLQRLTPRVSGEFLNTRQRPNDEIDARLEQQTTGAGLGLSVSAGSRLTFDADARRTRYEYAQGDYGSWVAAQTLNRDSDVASVTTRVELTPLTSLAARAEWIEDRFAHSKERNSDSLRVMSGVVFQPFALVSGSALVGMRRLTALDPAIPDYSGVVADVELKYVALDMLRVVGRIKRDIDYSLDPAEPYYVFMSIGAEVTQLVGMNWDIVGRARHGSLDYPELSAIRPGRVDTVDEFGGGFGRRIGERMRIGFDATYVRRWSVIPSRTYDGIRLGGSFVYGY